MEQKFYGDNPRWFIGTVVNSVDPQSRGRIQIRIHGIHTADQNMIPREALPWAEAALPVTEGGVSGIGKIPQVIESALVFGIFLDGDKAQSPMVLGVMPQIERPSQVQVNQSISKGTYEKYARGQAFSGGVTVSSSLRQSYAQSGGDRDAARMICMSFFVKNGLSTIAAAGITGNLEGESGFSPTANAVTSKENSVGIAQWNKAAAAGFRGKKLFEWAAEQNEPSDDIFLQLRFLLHEIRGESGDYYNSQGEFFHIHKKLKDCTSFEGGQVNTNSTFIFLKYFEKPAKPWGPKLAQREQYARTAYEQYLNSLQQTS